MEPQLHKKIFNEILQVHSEIKHFLIQKVDIDIFERIKEFLTIDFFNCLFEFCSIQIKVIAASGFKIN